MSGTGANTYRVGDFVYFEDPTSPEAPYQIRKIDELNKTQNGVEARVLLYARRRDVAPNLLKIADQAQRRFDNYYEVDKKKPDNFTVSKGFVVASAPASNGAEKEKEEQKKETEESDQGEVEVKKEENGEEEEKPKEEVEGQQGGEPNDENEKKEETEETKPEKQEEEKKEEEESTEQKEKTEKVDEALQIDWGDGGLPLGAQDITSQQRLHLRQHEVFLSRQFETLPAHQIRGKCRVQLLGEVETCDTYVAADDLFFYSLVYDPVNQTLLADKGAIRVGEKYQATVDEWKEPGTESEEQKEEKMETEEDDDDEEGNGALKIDEEDGKEEATTKTEESTSQEDEEVVRDVQVYHPNHGLTDRDIDQFLIVARAVGTFARAIDSSSSSKIPTLHMAAACASRDVTILHAMSLLHHAEYDVGKAVKFLVPPANKKHYPLESDATTGNRTQVLGGPLLCRDQMEEWSTPEANLFDEALEKYGKDFNDIRADYLPWKSIRDIVEYYYQYKASNRYSDRKKTKQTEAESKLKQVYIPSYNKTTPSIIGNFNMTQTVSKSPITCENCACDESQNWYMWGGKGQQVRLCQACWFKWKKKGGLDKKHELERFDKNRTAAAPAPAGATATATVTAHVSSNGILNQKPIVNNMGGGRTTATVPATNSVAAGLQNKAFNNQSLLNAAKIAFSNGQITKTQLMQLQQRLGMTPPVVAKPASKPNIVFYTTVCRRTIRRILPKTALNMRKLARKPFIAVDNEAVLKAVAITDRSTLIDTARNLAGAGRADKFSETDFNKGIIHLQHTISAAAAGAAKRPSSTTTTTAGEPPAKMHKS